jgi:hypothetical protein
MQSSTSLTTRLNEEERRWLCAVVQLIHVNAHARALVCVMTNLFTQRNLADTLQNDESQLTTACKARCVVCCTVTLHVRVCVQRLTRALMDGVSGVRDEFANTATTYARDVCVRALSVYCDIVTAGGGMVCTGN